MSIQVETLEKNMAKLTIEVSADELETALQEAYKKQKNSINIPGFRKGKVPRNVIEKMYGPAVFYEDAADILLQQTYYREVSASEVEVVSRPDIDIVQIEKGKPFIYTATVAVKPEVTLGEYKGVAVTKADVTVSDEDIMAEIDKEREKNSREVTVEDRAIENGDTAVIDFDGSVDGVAFDGGKGENYPLEIGSGSFIPGFEEQLIGKNAGDDVAVEVTFPEDYHAEELKGKAAVFQVKIHEVKTKELPEFDDDFAQDVSEFDTAEEYKADVAKKLAERKENAAKYAMQEEALDKIVEASEMEIPDPMIDTRCESMINQFGQQLASQGLSMDQYMQYTGITVDSLKEQVRPDALKQIKRDLVLEAVAKAEGFEITEEDVEAEVAKMAEAYGLPVEQIKNMMNADYEESIKDDLSVRKAMEFIGDNADPSLEPAAEAAEE